MPRPLVVAVLGATGAVGRKMVQILEERKFPVKELRCLASSRGERRTIPFRGSEIPVRAVEASAFDGVDLVLGSTPNATSREWSPLAVAKGATVVDNSSAWRMDPEVPLVVPEVNAVRLRSLPKGIVANPNCAAIQLVVAVNPLHELGGIKRLLLCTYQASSGKGAAALEDLDQQIRDVAEGKEPRARAHTGILAGNVLAFDWKPGEDGYSEEEVKIQRETRKILELPHLPISVTTARVPVRTGHSEAIHLELERAVTPEAAREKLGHSPGVVLVDIPTPRGVEGRDEVQVGRIRRDFGFEHGLALWACADNLRKGAATNAVQIAEVLLAQGRWS